MILALSLLLGQRLRAVLPRPPGDSGLLYYAVDFWDEYGSAEVRDFPLLAAGPWKLVILLGLYMYLVAVVWSKQGRTRPVSFRAPVILLLNGSQLGLNGAWFLVALFVSPYGQKFANPFPDTKTAQFICLLRVYICCCFLLFKLVQLALSVVLLCLRRRRRLSRLELAEGVTLPLVVYFLAKFGHFDFLLTISLINTVVSFISSAYYTLSAAKVVVPFPNRNWEAIILGLKSVQYATFYFVAGCYLTASRASSVPTAIKALGLAYATVMNFVVWCSICLFAVETPLET